MGSRLAAAALAVALLGCGGAEKKRAPAPDEEVVIDADSVSSFDCQAATDEFARKISERRAVGLAMQVVRMEPVKNEVGASLDPAAFQRMVEQRLLELGLEVSPGLDGQPKPEGAVVLRVSKEKLDASVTRFQLQCILIDLSADRPVVTTMTAITKMKE